ncbi:MAG: FAD:protein FMN transferase [Acetobacter sp.]|nr:FAD:protein FMN transferase [Bacteroides sp.]MCM1341232.1 FAD:protein FMN transferase [Acetobacter sp.]MCM1433875.1 FAD:protein FMN transferase [Clostridiales bacterium]
MKKFLCAALAVLIAMTCCSCSVNINKKERYSSSFLDLFDTASTIIAYDESQQKFDEHFKEFYDRLAEYDRLYDIYNSYDGIANLCTVNQEASKKPVKVDARIIDLLEYGKEVYKLSDGKTNICCGTVLSIWHDARETSTNNPDKAYLPDMSELKNASQHTDIDDLVIDKENRTIYFADSMLKLDVGAIAKGYAVKEITLWAKENLWTSAAISIGGNVSTFGYKNDNGCTLWNIGIENPDLSSKDYLENIAITDLSVVTSGDYQRYYTVDGKKYCHIINPKTLMPSEYMASVSVICSDSALGDALSTTLFNMSIDDGMKMVNSMQDTEAVWVDKNYNKTYSNGFEKYIKQ